jgi:hypothetical protein
MSLTIHLASMPRRPTAKTPSAQVSGIPVKADSSGALVVFRRVIEVTIRVTGMILAFGAIIAFKIWMWLPQGHS